MRRLLPVFLICATAGGAAADGFYFTESLGGTNVKDELGSRMSSAVRIKLALGVRRRSWAIEGWIAGDIAANEGYGDGYGYDGGAAPPPCASRNSGCEGPYDTAVGYGPTSLTTYGLDLKYLQPVSEHIEIYLRGSISHGVMSGQLDGYGGRGLGVGAGVQLKGKVPAIGFLWWPLFFTGWGPKVTAAVFVDDGYDFYRLHPGDRLEAGPAIDAQLSHLTLGFAVGSDF